MRLSDFPPIPALLAVAVVAALAGCSDPAPDRAGASVETAPEARSSTGAGTVTALDREVGTVTIEHGPMPAIGWSAMTMTFAADPALLAGVAAGDRVAFEVTVTDNRGTITSLRAE